MFSLFCCGCWRGKYKKEHSWFAFFFVHRCKSASRKQPGNELVHKNKQLAAPSSQISPGYEVGNCGTFTRSGNWNAYITGVVFPRLAEVNNNLVSDWSMPFNMLMRKNVNACCQQRGSFATLILKRFLL